MKSIDIQKSLNEARSTEEAKIIIAKVRAEAQALAQALVIEAKVQVVNTNPLRIFSFSGFGNFSGMGWDNGLSSRILGNAIPYKEAFQMEWDAAEAFSACVHALPMPIVAGVFPTFGQEYGGSRNINGFVIAASEKKARALLMDFDATFEKVEYQNNQY